MLSTNHKLKILTTQAPVTRALVSRDAFGQLRIVWPWVISDEQRLTVEAATIYERLNEPHLDYVFDVRTVLANKGEL